MSTPSSLELLTAADTELNRFLGKIQDADRDKKTNGEGWTVLEQLEHIFIVEKGVRNALLAPGQNKAQEKHTLFGDEWLGKRMRGNDKWLAPEMVKPKGRFTDITSVKNVLLEQRAFIRQKLENDEIVFDGTTFPHPIIGEMTRADWFFFMLHHTERHIRQVESLLTA